MKWPEQQTTDNLLDNSSTFIDQHLRWFQNALYIMFAGAAILVAKRIHLISEFKSVSEIPSNFFDKRISIRGRVLDATESGHLYVKHIPIVNVSRFKKGNITGDGKGISVKLIGLQASASQQPRIQEELNKLKGKKVWMQLIHRDVIDDKQIDNEQFLHCLVSRQWVFLNFYVNYRLLRLGLAQVSPLPIGVNDQALTDRLFKAQKRAIFWKRGVWKKPR